MPKIDKPETDRPVTSSPAFLSSPKDERRRAPSAERNRGSIHDVLKEIAPSEGLLFEVASGTGDHAAWIGPKLAPLIWQTSEYSPELFPSICAHIAHAGSENLRRPLAIDVTQKGWNLSQDKRQALESNIDVITCVNMIHISPWAATLGLISGASTLLKKGGALFLYGPFIQDQVETASSNLQFDASLRQRNNAWGIRRLEDVQEVAEKAGLSLEEIIPMPANNLSVIFRKQ